MQNFNEIQHRQRILFIDDSSLQLTLYKDQLSDGYEVCLANDYQTAIEVLSTNQPDIIVLDMVMPQVNGLEFLDILRNTDSFKSIPVIMVSGENDIEVVRQSFLRGASDYVRKPYDLEELRLRISRLLDLKPRVQTNQDKLVVQSHNASSLMIRSLSDLAATRDNETGNHLLRIEKYVNFLTTKAAYHPQFKDKIGKRFLEFIGEVSQLHDIGKVGIPDNILQKPGPLTQEEFKVMQTHTTIGSQTLAQIRKSFPDYEFLTLAEEIARTHHEKFDGRGYPAGLSGGQIPLSGRIVAIADVFDALTTKRVYKEAFTVDKAIAIMKDGQGSHFDPVLLSIFFNNLNGINKIYEQFKEPR